MARGPEHSRNWGGRRPGAGKKPGPEELKTTSIVLPARILGWAREKAKDQGISLSKLATKALEAWLITAGKSDPIS